MVNVNHCYEGYVFAHSFIPDGRILNSPYCWSIESARVTKEDAEDLSLGVISIDNSHFNLQKVSEIVLKCGATMLQDNGYYRYGYIFRPKRSPALICGAQNISEAVKDVFVYPDTARKVKVRIENQHV